MPSQEPTSQNPPARQDHGRVLLAYFSRAGENYHYGGRTDLTVGNTEVLAGMIKDRFNCEIHQYDTVLLASGIWNVRPPMIMTTFAESYDFTGKTIHPITTHAMSGLGNTESGYAKFCPGGFIGQGLAVKGEEVRDAGPSIDSWLQRTRLVEK